MARMKENETPIYCEPNTEEAQIMREVHGLIVERKKLDARRRDLLGRLAALAREEGPFTSFRAGDLEAAWHTNTRQLTLEDWAWLQEWHPKVFDELGGNDRTAPFLVVMKCGALRRK